MARIITPNLPEAEALLGRGSIDAAAMEAAKYMAAMETARKAVA